MDNLFRYSNIKKDLKGNFVVNSYGNLLPLTAHQ